MSENPLAGKSPDRAPDEGQNVQRVFRGAGAFKLGIFLVPAVEHEGYDSDGHHPSQKCGCPKLDQSDETKTGHSKTHCGVEEYRLLLVAVLDWPT